MRVTLTHQIPSELLGLNLDWGQLLKECVEEFLSVMVRAQATRFDCPTYPRVVDFPGAAPR